DLGAALARLGDRVQRLGAVPRGGKSPDALDLTQPTAFVLGHETRGLPAGIDFDGLVTVPMAGGESLNVAMAATALLFDAARQRRHGR
ncbi:MAG TPA: TrmH family RNA methyltransferase, partial [Acidimicrobiia bacterium]|nr:TrmH family RNA methyltransferase [Acidimicrobiia bacterium]